MPVKLENLPDETFGHISPTEARILDVLIHHHPRGIRSEDLHDFIANGSSTYNVRTGNTIVCKLRQKLEAFGWDVSRAKSPPTRGVYRLQPFAEKAKK